MPTPYAIDYTGSGLDPKLASGGNLAVKDGTTYNAAPAPTPAPAPAAPVSALSSSAGSTTIDQHVADHAVDMNNISMNGARNGGADPYAGLTKIYNKDTGAESYLATGGTPGPGWVTADEAKAAGIIIPSQASSEDMQFLNDKKSINDAFAAQSNSLDVATQNLISSIQGIYSSRIADQADQNRRELANVNTGNVRFGTDRYSPGTAGGILSSDERQGLDRIQKIAGEEANLIAQANQSLQDKKYQLFVQQRNELASLRKDRLAALTKLKDDAYKATQDKITNDLNALIHKDTVSYQEKQQAIAQAQLDETVRKDKAAELAKAADLKLKQDAAALISGAMSSPVGKVNGVTSPADQQKFLSTYTPNMQTIIKGVADYSIDPNSASKRAGSAITPLALEALAKAYDPDYKAGNYEAVKKFLTSWSSGGNNSVVQSANTVVQHLDELAKVVPTLANASSGSLGPFTKAYNNTKQWVMENNSDPNVFKFKQTALLVASEMAKIMKNGSGSSASPTDTDIGEQLSLLTTGLSPNTAKALIENGAQLMGDRLNTARENYINVVGAAPKQVLFPSAQKALEELKAKGYAIDLSSLDPSPFAGASDADLVRSINGGGGVAATSTPATYFNALLDIINQPAPADAQ